MKQEIKALILNSGENPYGNLDESAPTLRKKLKRKLGDDIKTSRSVAAISAPK